MKSKLICLIAIILAGCSPKLMPSTETNTSHKDSVRVVEVTKDSLVYVPIPLEKNQVIVHVGDTSRLETSIAWSEAYVSMDGFLHHVLENKHKEKLPVVVPIHSKEIYVGVSDKSSQVMTKYEYVDRPLSKWKSFKLGAFWWLLGGVILLLVWTFRKQIAKLVKLWII